MTTQAGHFCICIFIFVRFLCIMRLREFIFYVATELFDRHKAARWWWCDAVTQQEEAENASVGLSASCGMYGILALYTCHTSNVERACVPLERGEDAFHIRSCIIILCKYCSWVQHWVVLSAPQIGVQVLSALLMPLISISDFHLVKFAEKVLTFVKSLQNYCNFVHKDQKCHIKMAF
jgi:hypothetical protein